MTFTKVLDVGTDAIRPSLWTVDKAVYQGAIPGMLRMLDPPLEFSLTHGNLRFFARGPAAGKYYGVGMVVAPRENHTGGDGALRWERLPITREYGREDVIVKVDEKSTEGPDKRAMLPIC